MNNITIEWSAEDRARIDRLAELLERITAGHPATTAPAEETETLPWEQAPATTAPAEPAEGAEPAEAAQVEQTTSPAPDRRTVKSLAVKKIQAGHRDAVKSLITAYGAEKIDLVPEDRLAAFLADLEAI